MSREKHSKGLISMNKAFQPDVRIRLIGKRPFFGPGVAELLQCIHDCGSVAAACKKMKLSYSKGRSMLRLMESELGFSVVERTKGGSGGGGAAIITEKGEALLTHYRAFEDEVCAFAQNRFQQMFEKTEY